MPHKLNININIKIMHRHETLEADKTFEYRAAVWSDDADAVARVLDGLHVVDRLSFVVAMHHRYFFGYGRVLMRVILESLLEPGDREKFASLVFQQSYGLADMLYLLEWVGPCKERVDVVPLASECILNTLRYRTPGSAFHALQTLRRWRHESGARIVLDPAKSLRIMRTWAQRLVGLGKHWAAIESRAAHVRFLVEWMLQDGARGVDLVHAASSVCDDTSQGLWEAVWSCEAWSLCRRVWVGAVVFKND